jgi:hypothetical protein
MTSSAFSSTAAAAEEEEVSMASSLPSAAAADEDDEEEADEDEDDDDEVVGALRLRVNLEAAALAAFLPRLASASAWRSANDSLSGQMYLSEWNLCSSKYSLRSARCDCSERSLV